MMIKHIGIWLNYLSLTMTFDGIFLNKSVDSLKRSLMDTKNVLPSISIVTHSNHYSFGGFFGMIIWNSYWAVLWFAAHQTITNFSFGNSIATKLFDIIVTVFSDNFDHTYSILSQFDIFCWFIIFNVLFLYRHHFMFLLAQ